MESGGVPVTSVSCSPDREGVEGIGFIWYEDSFDGALRWAKEQMASGLVRWMAILHDFNDGAYEITVFDSLMEEVFRPIFAYL